jgi:hypothetical protein
MSSKTTDSINIADVMKIGRDWFFYFLSYWKILVIAGLIGAGTGFFYAFKSKKEYVGRLTFTLEEQRSGGVGAYAAIASQFGIDLGGSNNGAFSGDNLLELMKSRLMIEKTLLTPVVIDGKKELLINRYIRLKKYDETWAGDPYYNDVKFDMETPRSGYSLKEDSILNVIQSSIVKQSIMINRADKRLNFVFLECKSEDEYFAKYFTEILVANASSFYIETKTKKSRANVAILEHKVDSVKGLLDRLLFASALSQDQNLNVVKAKSRVSYTQNQIDVQLLTVVYAELSKNLELASFSLMRDEPLMQVIDTPILPLRFNKPGKMHSMIVFGIVSGILAMMLLAIRRVLKKEFSK